MKTNLYILLIFLGISFSGCSQKLRPEDDISRRNADNIASEIFAKETSGNNYIMFSVAEKSYLVIIDVKDTYEEYFYNSESKRKSDVTIIKKSNQLFNKMFDKTNYKKEFITFDSDFFKPHYEVSSGNITYFVFKSNNQRLGEARLSFFIKPNPINVEVYLYLTTKILEYNRIVQK